MSVFPYMKQVGVIFLLGVLLQACSPTPSSLKPVSQQNQQNIEALSSNVHLLMELYEPLLAASSTSLINQRIGKAMQEMIAVVGAPALPAPSADLSWEDLFVSAARSPLPRREKYLERYQFVNSALARGIDSAEQERLKNKEGWIYLTASDPSFTPQKVHGVLKSLRQLRKTTKGANYFVEAELLLSSVDPILVTYRQTVEAASVLLAALKQELNLQLTTATIHSQAISRFAKVDISVKQTLDAALVGIDKNQLYQVLQALAQKNIENPNLRDTAITLLTKGVNKFIASR